MNTLLVALFLFLICCIFGWVLEVCFRSFLAHQLVNPGMLKGPWLPIYGIGGLLLFYFAQRFCAQISSTPLRILCTFVLGGLLMTVLEAVGGLFFLKYYHTRLWDYSDRPYNYLGVICLSFSLCWGALCVLFAEWLNPLLARLAITATSFEITTLVLGVLYGFFFVDLFRSLQIVTKCRRYARRHGLVIVWNQIRAQIRYRFHSSG